MKKPELITNEDLNKKSSLAHLRSKIICGETYEVLRKIPSKSVPLIVTSPSYFLGKPYEKNQKFKEYLKENQQIIKECKRILKDNGAIFWNVAQTIVDGEILPLGAFYYDIFKKEEFFLKNWIIWKFEGGETPRSRLFGRYENILWFVKNKKDYIFNLDDVRVPSKWINDKRCNKNGKNPEDFWIFDERSNIDKIRNVRDKIKECKKLLSQDTDQYVNQILMDEIYRDLETELDELINSKNNIVNKNLPSNIWHINRVVNISKTQKIKHPITKETHPCPFPEALIQRIIKMATNQNDLVVDIFAGSGTVAKVAQELKRNWICIEKEMKYCEIAKHRLTINKEKGKQLNLF